MPINSLTVNLQAVTPLFLAGADGQTAELRPPSFRGALRFWLRALLGGASDYQRLEYLRAKESEIFGSTSEASRIIVRLKGQPHSSVPNLEHEGLAYLFFGLTGRGRGQSAREAISAGHTFRLTLQVRPVKGANGKDGSTLTHAGAALWLLTHVGGVGARVRRGGGAIQAMPTSQVAETFALPAWSLSATSPAELQAELARGINGCREALGLEWAKNIGVPEFTVLHPDAASIFIVDKEWESWDMALNELGLSFRNFRSRRPPDYQRVKNAIQRYEDFEEVERAAFGLPIVFYYSSIRKSDTLEGEHHGRRASPLWFRVVRLRNGRYTILLLVFKSRLLQEGEQLKLRRTRVLGETPDYSIIDTFLQTLGEYGVEDDCYLAPLRKVELG